MSASSPWMHPRYFPRREIASWSLPASFGDTHDSLDPRPPAHLHADGRP